jgi:hypothetical protein
MDRAVYVRVVVHVADEHEARARVAVGGVGDGYDLLRIHAVVHGGDAGLGVDPEEVAAFSLATHDVAVGGFEDMPLRSAKGGGGAAGVDAVKGSGCGLRVPVHQFGLDIVPVVKNSGIAARGAKGLYHGAKVDGVNVDDIERLGAQQIGEQVLKLRGCIVQDGQGPTAEGSLEDLHGSIRRRGRNGENPAEGGESFAERKWLRGRAIVDVGKIPHPAEGAGKIEVALLRAAGDGPRLPGRQAKNVHTS